MPTPPSIQQTAIKLCPEKTAVFYSAKVPANAILFDEERAHTHGMIDKRRLEFMHGRHCAREAMQMLNLQPAAIGKDTDRSPIWPRGVVGSISHTDDAAIAVVATSERLKSIGIDMESAGPLEAQHASLICLPGENTPHDGMRAKLLFSIKEAIYKCLHPITGSYIDFLEMEAPIDPGTLTFVAKAHTSKLDPEIVGQIKGRYAIADDMILSVAWLNPDS